MGDKYDDCEVCKRHEANVLQLPLENDQISNLGIRHCWSLCLKAKESNEEDEAMRYVEVCISILKIKDLEQHMRGYLIIT